MNKDHQKIMVSEEKIFGNEFVIIRKTYVFEDYNKQNLILNKKEY